MKSRGRRAERFWARYAGSIAFIALILISGLGFARIENARYSGCVAGNALRQGLRTAEFERLEESRSVDPKTLFPNLSPAVYQKLLRESEEQTFGRINHLYADRPCGTRIDLPLTGAAVVFPP